jgi:hypothetical protein
MRFNPAKCELIRLRADQSHHPQHAAWGEQCSSGSRR